MAPERLVVGIIIKPHGIRGEVVVDVLSEAPERFQPGAALYADERELTVRAARPHQSRLLVTFDGVDDRNAAEGLRGVELEIDAADALPLGADSYYAHQLEGLGVVGPGGELLGTLVRVEPNPAHDHWVVRTDTGEVLVPAVKEFVRSVDLEAGRVELDPPDGLFGS